MNLQAYNKSSTRLEQILQPLFLARYNNLKFLKNYIYYFLVIPLVPISIKHETSFPVQLAFETFVIYGYLFLVVASMLLSTCSCKLAFQECKQTYN